MKNLIKHLEEKGIGKIKECSSIDNLKEGSKVYYVDPKDQEVIFLIKKLKCNENRGDIYHGKVIKNGNGEYEACLGKKYFAKDGEDLWVYRKSSHLKEDIFKFYEENFEEKKFVSFMLEKLEPTFGGKTAIENGVLKIEGGTENQLMYESLEESVKNRIELKTT